MNDAGELPRVSSFGTPIDQLGNGIIMLTDPSEEVNNIALMLNGFTKASDGSWVKTDEAWLNNDGVSKIMANIRPNVSQNINLSNYEDRQVSNVMDVISDCCIKTLLMGRKKFGLKEASNRDIIYNMVVLPSFGCYRRGYKEGDKKFLSKTSQDIKHTIDDGRKGGGLLDRFNFFKR